MSALEHAANPDDGKDGEYLSRTSMKICSIFPTSFLVIYIAVPIYRL